MARAPLSFRRLSGLDRSGPPPAETQAGAPLHPWTIPNAIGFVRAALIPVFLVLAGAIVCWKFELLPRWALAVLAAREAFMLVAAPLLVRRGVELRINWPGRLSVAPIMGAIFFALCGLHTLGEVLLYVGLALSLTATFLYGRTAVRELSSST